MKKGFFTSNNYLNIKDLLLFFGIYLIVSMIVGMSIIKIANTNAINGVTLLVSYIVIHSIIIGLLIFYRKLRTKSEKEPIPFKYGSLLKFPSPIRLLWGIILLFAASFVADPIIALFPKSQDSIYTIFRSAGVYGMFSAVVAAPILEEIIFRGIIMSDIRRNYSSLTAILISALTFAIVHFNMAQFVGAFLIGTVFGYIFLLTESLSSVIFLHFFNNAISYMIIKLLPQEIAMNSFYQAIPSKGVYYAIYAICVVVIVYMIVKMVELTRKHNKERKVDIQKSEDNLKEEKLEENSPIDTKN